MAYVFFCLVTHYFVETIPLLAESILYEGGGNQAFAGFIGEWLWKRFIA